MRRNNEIKQEIERLKRKLADEMKAIEKIDILVRKKIERDVGIWEFNYEELEKELWNRFSSLEKNSDCLSFEKIKSPRKKIGWLIVFFKKIFREITKPYSRLMLDKQNRFNQELIPFHLATILSLQKLKDRLNVFEEQAHRIMENQEELIEELKSLQSKDKN